MSALGLSLTGPLPLGTTVLEASAGTGKTYAIAALAARFIAEGVADIEHLLLVTFSRAATAELRLRVRERLRSTARELRTVAAGGVAHDAVSTALAQAGPDEVAARARRLEDAFARFDRATIMTTHEFCHGMLRGLGVLAPQTPQSTLVEDLGRLADEVAADLYVSWFADAASEPPFAFGTTGEDADPGARSIARDAVATGAALTCLDDEGTAGIRARFAAAAREEVDRRKAERRLYGFDDMLDRLARALADPECGAEARTRLSRRYPVVLVDEFQDTDPVQWEVLQRAFVGSSRVVLIGDPKQSIYAFRGADVHAYGTAVHAADQMSTLGVNHRSDADLVRAVGALFEGVRLGEEILVPPVEARHGARSAAAGGSPWAAGVQIRSVEAQEPVSPWAADDAIAADLVHVVASLLDDNPPLLLEGRPPSPGDLAVLVRRNRRGHEVAEALGRAGVPATFSGTNSVFATAAAADWVTLLRALDQTRRPYVQRAVLTDFLGGTVARLATADDEQASQWSILLHTWARVLAQEGVPALLTALDADTDFTARLLGRPGGERLVTDHRHLAELLHEHARRWPAARARDLAQWLVGQVDEADSGTERTRRLETDADAVSIMTVHRAKGLQWPVVLLPESCARHDPREQAGRHLLVPGPGGRELDLGGRHGSGRAQRYQRWRVEEGDEELRALYVGLTRAQSHAVVWWAHHWNVGGSPLHRLLHAAHNAARPERPRLSYDPRGLPDGGSPRLLGWLEDAAIATVHVDDRAPSRPGTDRPVDAGPLAARAFARTVDRDFRRTSYSGLTAPAHGQAGSGEDGAWVADEPAGPEDVAPADPAWSAPSPWAGLPGGAAFGTLVHAVFEGLDASGPTWRDDLAAVVTDQVRRRPLVGVEAGALASAMEPSLTTPLGPLAPGATLRAFSRRDRLSELDFEFALANPAATVADVAGLMTAHLPDGDPLGSYPARLAQPALGTQRLHGFLTGSIDAVLRLDGHGAGHGFLVVDYKTNRLAPTDVPLTLGHHTPAALAEAMMSSHYPLQALLYSVALHRYLRLRLDGYRPERDLAGVAYLFVRGMGGPDTPVVGGHPLGVFSWRPPAALVVAVSTLLAGGIR